MCDKVLRPLKKPPMFTAAVDNSVNKL